MQESIVFAPELDERQLDSEVGKVDETLNEVGNDVPVSFNPEEDMGMGDGLAPPGADGGGIPGGGAGAAAGLASKLPGPVAGVTASAALPVALAGGVGLGMLSAMSDASARLQTSANILGTAKDNFFREPGNVLDENIVRPLSEDILSLSTEFGDDAREKGVTIAFGELLAGATVKFGKGAFDFLKGSITDIEAEDLLGPVGELGPDIVTGIVNEISGHDFDSFSDMADKVGEKIVEGFDWPDLPAFSWPNLPPFSWPNIPTPDLDVEPPELPDNFWPEVSLPSDFWPDVTPPSDLFPDLEVPTNFWPDVAVPDIDIPRAELPDDFWPDVDAPDLDVPEFPGWPDLDYDIPDFPGWGDFVDDMSWFYFVDNLYWFNFVPDLDWDDFIDSVNPFSGTTTSSVTSADTGGFVEQTGAAIIHEGERVVPEAQVSDRGPAPVETTVNANMDTSTIEDKLDRLHSDLQQLQRAMDVTLKVDKETLGRATNDARRNRMGDTDPTV